MRSILDAVNLFAVLGSVLFPFFGEKQFKQVNPDRAYFTTATAANAGDHPPHLTEAEVLVLMAVAKSLLSGSPEICATGDLPVGSKQTIVPCSDSFCPAIEGSPFPHIKAIASWAAHGAGAARQTAVRKITPERAPFKVLIGSKALSNCN